MPFGLVGAPRTFQRLMDRILRGLEHRIALTYLDDVIVYGAQIEEVLRNLDCVFERLLAAGVKLKGRKRQITLDTSSRTRESNATLAKLKL